MYLKRTDVRIVFSVCTGAYLALMVLVWGGLTQDRARAKNYGYQPNPTTFWETMTFCTGVIVVIPLGATALALLIRKKTHLNKTLYALSALWLFWGIAMALCLTFS